MINDQKNSPPSPKLLDQVRQAIRMRHYSLRTEQAYVGWVKRYILFHNKRHPLEMGAVEVTAFLTSLADAGHVAVATHQQALSALLFLYKEVLQVELPWLDELSRPKRPPRLPTVLTQAEVQAVIARLDGVFKLQTRLLYGTGMRLLEMFRLRIKDIDFAQNQITVREGKGGKDRLTMLPQAIAAQLKEPVESARLLWQDDVQAGRAGVHMPDALDRKYPQAGQSLPWF